MSGRLRAKHKALAYVRPTRREPASPGPEVTATASSDESSTFACCSASRTTATTARRCSREASSGTTPPYLPCVSNCEATMEERMVHSSAMTAAAVSSHEDSMAKRGTLLPYKATPVTFAPSPSALQTGWAIFEYEI